MPNSERRESDRRKSNRRTYGATMTERENAAIRKPKKNASGGKSGGASIGGGAATGGGS